MLESAIPIHLTQERTQPAKTPHHYEPPTLAYTSRFPENVKDIVMAVIGAQYASAADNDGAAISKILEFMKNSTDTAVQPSFWELASVTDVNDSYNIAVIAYWPSKETYERWNTVSNFKTWWKGLEAEGQQHGWFLEVFSPTTDRFETIASDEVVLEGTANMREKVSGPILEHVYWGSMRDRMPICQTDAVPGDSADSAIQQTGSTARRRVRVPGRQNLVVIRSGQDWSNTRPEEHKLYVDTMQPPLVQGMTFLRDNGKDIGCYSCRLMDVVDNDTFEASKNRTFGLAYFDSLGSLEKWSRQHPTHLSIFGTFMKYVKRLNNNISLRLFHEVLVLKPEQQFFEYVGCHERTGMLGSLSSS
ncbi:phenylacetaldoxime dehydratase [Nannizzia gypsea CBS 118893]|uniref:Phenylacetaldoxime dehydratase n=1 Tax=Arthroderma gypseum (strain ATCC MYA-4604 / CBS 118893) TaxID=535722 RepID=E5QYJ0_ARTGP|nr:phenylacetaldoxime dehydratase [Nannizzia gypsea CBS 118893]EFQ98066.1 phenylacetaldoxime dehydratase [Nannizzia gypsea CBS 118893]